MCFMLKNVSKHNLNREKQVVLLIISNREKWNYLAVKELAALWIRNNSKNTDEFIVWIVFITLGQKKFWIYEKTLWLLWDSGVPQNERS